MEAADKITANYSSTLVVLWGNLPIIHTVVVIRGWRKSKKVMKPLHHCLLPPSNSSLLLHLFYLYSIPIRFLTKGSFVRLFTIAITFIVLSIPKILACSDISFRNIFKMQFLSFVAVFGLAALAAAAPQEESSSASMTSKAATATSSIADMTISTAPVSPTTTCVAACESNPSLFSCVIQMRY
jgi:hypothetical protein